jgi:ATP-dependent Clp protease adaptor protein ClpS
MSKLSNPKTNEQTLTIEKTQLPKKYKVVILNDDYTPMEFVIFIFQDVFHLDYDQSYSLMMKIHNEGRAVAGIFTKEIAETKVTKVHALAKENGHPLKSIIEPE